jgi:hypothetical protein
LIGRHATERQGPNLYTTPALSQWLLGFSTLIQLALMKRLTAVGHVGTNSGERPRLPKAERLESVAVADGVGSAAFVRGRWPIVGISGFWVFWQSQ